LGVLRLVRRRARKKLLVKSNSLGLGKLCHFVDRQ